MGHPGFHPVIDISAGLIKLRMCEVVWQKNKMTSMLESFPLT